MIFICTLGSLPGAEIAPSHRLSCVSFDCYRVTKGIFFLLIFSFFAIIFTRAVTSPHWERFPRGGGRGEERRDCIGVWRKSVNKVKLLDPLNSVIRIKIQLPRNVPQTVFFLSSFFQSIPRNWGTYSISFISYLGVPNSSQSTLY